LKPAATTYAAKKSFPPPRLFMQRDLQFLLDMLQSAELIVNYTRQCSKDEFLGNVQLQDSVIRRLLVIAEAARRVSEATRQTLPNISWQEINGMRNRLVHEYDDVNLNIVWDVVQTEMPTMIEELKLQVPPEG
jgi:uncharacterized protein with HEPN domain